MFAKKLAGVIAVGLMWVPLLAAYPADEPLVFNTTAPTNDLKGSLAARVQFAQSQIVPSRPQKGDNQPHLESAIGAAAQGRWVCACAGYSSRQSGEDARLAPPRRAREAAQDRLLLGRNAG